MPVSQLLAKTRYLLSVSLRLTATLDALSLLALSATSHKTVRAVLSV